jgi:hypothetical protein
VSDYAATSVSSRTAPHRPDKQYDTAQWSAMKSHPGFHFRNFRYALARDAIYTASSVDINFARKWPHGSRKQISIKLDMNQNWT